MSEATSSIQVDFRKQFRAGDRSFSLDVRFESRAYRIVIHGPSGSGKSLLLKCLAGLLTPDSGRIVVNRKVLFDRKEGISLPPRQRPIGLMLQDYALFPHLTVRQNVAFGLMKRWWNPLNSLREPAVEDVLRTLRIADVAHQYPHQLSGGQQQRTALGRALVLEPKVLLLDEPFAALDEQLRLELRGEVRGWQQRKGFILLIVTHDPDDIDFFGGEVLQMVEGSLLKK